MAHGLRYHPEYLASLEAVASANPAAPLSPPPIPKDVYALRKTSTEFMAMVMQAVEIPEAVNQSKFSISTYDGADIDIFHFAPPRSPSASSSRTPAVLYFHGGGRISCDVSIFSGPLAQQALSTGVPIFAVEYRLAPEKRGASAAEDAFHALRHVSEHAAEWNIDPSRIVVQGDSAGGGIAASCALLARDRQFYPPIASLVLIYPMLDDRTKIPADSPLRPFLTWRAEWNELAWKAVLGDAAGDPSADVSIYSAAGRAEDLHGLPPTFIDVGNLDLFCQESVEFATKLIKADVEVELHLYPGLPHGYDAMPNVPVARQAIALRYAAIKRLQESS